MSKCVLIVEDEYHNQQILSALFTHIKVMSDVTSTAEEGLLALENKVYDAVIIDLELPGMDGLALLKQIRKQSKFADLPCIVMTAYANSYVKDAAMKAGCTMFFPKPFDHKKFMTKMNHLLD